MAGIGILIYNHIEKGRMKENFEHQIEDLTKGDNNNVKPVLTHPQAENIRCSTVIPTTSS